MTKVLKELFGMAGEKLMPIRDGVCVLIFKVTTIAGL